MTQATKTLTTTAATATDSYPATTDVHGTTPAPTAVPSTSFGIQYGVVAASTEESILPAATSAFPERKTDQSATTGEHADTTELPSAVTTSILVPSSVTNVSPGVTAASTEATVSPATTATTTAMPEMTTVAPSTTTSTPATITYVIPSEATIDSTTATPAEETAAPATPIAAPTTVTALPLVAISERTEANVGQAITNDASTLATNGQTATATISGQHSSTDSPTTASSASESVISILERLTEASVDFKTLTSLLEQKDIPAEDSTSNVPDTTRTSDVNFSRSEATTITSSMTPTLTTTAAVAKLPVVSEAITTTTSTHLGDPSLAAQEPITKEDATQLHSPETATSSSVITTSSGSNDTSGGATPASMNSIASTPQTADAVTTARPSAASTDSTSTQAATVGPVQQFLLLE